jgi:hypothetical protein
MKKIIVLSTILSACGSSGSKNEPLISTRPVNTSPIPTPKPSQTTSPEPDLNKRIQHRPAWLSPEWADDTFILSGGEPGNWGIWPEEVPAAEDLYRYFEGVRSKKNWDVTIKHGVKPAKYLELPKTPDGIEWVDATGGQIPGFEKLRPVLSEMTKRCPSLAREDLQAPLQVVWATEKDLFGSGQFFPNDVFIRWEKGRVTLDANTNLRPSIKIRAEYLKVYGDGSTGGWKWPKQTFTEITGGKTYADGGYTFFAIDQTFAHEYGHFLLQAWALNNGRSNLQSQYFAEGWAEFFKAVCWGDLQDNPEWVKSQIDFETRHGELPFAGMEKLYKEANHRFSRSNEYMLDSIGNLITVEAHNGTYEPDVMLQAGLLALESVKGRQLRDYPVISPIDGLLADSPHWTDSESFARPEIFDDVPVVITRSEWLRNFCPAYESLGKSCGHMRKVIEADAEGLERDEW